MSRNWNFEKLLIKKELSEGVPVTPTRLFPVISNDFGLQATIQKLSQVEWNMYGPTRAVPSKKSIGWKITSYAYASFLAVLLDWIFGNPTTSSIWGWKYQHAYDYTKNTVPTFTLEKSEGSTVVRSSGTKVTDFNISVDDAVLKADSTFAWLFGSDVLKIDSVVWTTLNFNTPNIYLADTDNVDILDASWNLITWNVNISSVTSNSITIPDATWITAWCLVTLTRKEGTFVSEHPVQFYADAHITINGNLVPVSWFTFSATNNVDTQEGYKSGSSFAQSLNTKMRTATMSFVVENEFVPLFKAANSTAGTVNVIADFASSIDETSIHLNTNCQVDSVPVSVSTNATLLSTVTLSIVWFNELFLVDSNATHDF